jgi:hypothetical protein
MQATLHLASEQGRCPAIGTGTISTRSTAYSSCQNHVSPDNKTAVKTSVLRRHRIKYFERMMYDITIIISFTTTFSCIVVPTKAIALPCLHANLLGTMVHRRARVSATFLDDVMHFRRLIMEKDPFKHKAPREEEMRSSVVVLTLWYKLSNTNVISDQVTTTHLLWTLIHCKQYERHKGTSSVRHPSEVLHRRNHK